MSKIVIMQSLKDPTETVAETKPVLKVLSDQETCKLFPLNTHVSPK